MKKILKRAIAVLAALILGVGIYTGVLFALDRDPIVTEPRAMWIIDVNDLNEVTGLSDHVFVGRVLSNTGVTFPPGGSIMPFTDYEIEVLDVIKGDLMPGVVVPAQKAGGPARFNLLAFLWTGGRTFFFINEGDFLPQVGNVYVFRASNYEGIIDIARGPNGQHLLVEGAEVEMATGDIMLHAMRSDYYAAAIAAYENEVPFELFEIERWPTPEEFRVPQE